MVTMPLAYVVKETLKALDTYRKYAAMPVDDLHLAKTRLNLLSLMLATRIETLEETSGFNLERLG